MTADGRFNLRFSGACRSLSTGTFSHGHVRRSSHRRFAGVKRHHRSRPFIALYTYNGSGTSHFHHDSDLLLGHLCRRNHRHLINTPGTAASATTCLDGYPLAQRGEAGRALGMAVVSSTIGGVFSVICLMIAAPFLARAAYNFSPPEYFALTLFGLSMLASIGDGSAIKNLIAGGLGIFLALVGVDNLTTVERFTFGSYELYDGIGFVPVMIGVFGISELLIQAANLQIVREQVVMKAITLPSKADYKKSWRTIVRSSGIGTFIGILPAEGATVASMIGYNEAKRWSKNPEEFGHGAIEGIAGSEAANNAATGGAMVPTLALGIPGSATAAVILAGLMVHGVRPGPTMFTEQAEFAYAIFWSMLLVNILFFLVGLRGAKIFARVTLIPVQILWPTVFVFSIVGTYALDQSMFDVWVALTAGVIGFFIVLVCYSLWRLF